MIGKTNAASTAGNGIVNGIIEEYYAATAEVNANTFVEYIQNLGCNIDGSNTELTTDSFSAATISAAKLSDNKVFVLFRNGSYGNDTAASTYAVICTISNGLITPSGEKTIQRGSGHTTYGVSNDVVALSSSSVLIAYSADNSYGVVALRVCTISGSTITVGTAVNTATQRGKPKLAKLSSTKVLVTYTNVSSKVYAKVCTISGTTVTAGAEMEICDAGSTAISAVVALSSSKVFLFHSYWTASTDVAAAATVCTVSGTSITKGTTKLISDEHWTNLDVKKLNDNKVLCAMTKSSGARALVCSVSGTTVTAGTITNVFTNYPTDSSLCALSESLACIAIRQYKTPTPVTYPVLIEVLKIQGMTISLGPTTTLIDATYNNESDVRVCEVSGNTVMVMYGAVTNSRLAGIVVTAEDVSGIQPLTAESKFLGLTATKATNAQKGKVWVLK